LKFIMLYLSILLHCVNSTYGSNIIHHTLQKKQLRATHITKTTRGNNNKRKKTALQ
jgi:hypothetical protein